MKTFYTFIKDGLRYTTKANNRYQARKKLESAFRISLAGTACEERYGAKLITSGKEA